MSEVKTLWPGLSLVGAGLRVPSSFSSASRRRRSSSRAAAAVKGVGERLDARARRADLAGEPRPKRPWDCAARERGDEGDGERGRLSSLIAASSEGMIAGGVTSVRVEGGGSIAVKAEASDAIEATVSQVIGKFKSEPDPTCDQFRSFVVATAFGQRHISGRDRSMCGWRTWRELIFFPRVERSERRVRQQVLGGLDGFTQWAVSGLGEECRRQN